MQPHWAQPHLVAHPRDTPDLVALVCQPSNAPNTSTACTCTLHSPCRWVIQRVCGDRGSNAVEFMLVWCCDRPNPTLQLSYMLLLTLGYWLYCTSVFVLLDPASSYHW